MIIANDNLTLLYRDKQLLDFNTQLNYPYKIPRVYTIVSLFFPSGCFAAPVHFIFFFILLLLLQQSIFLGGRIFTSKKEFNKPL